MEGWRATYRVAVLGRKALGLKAAWRADEKILDILTVDVVVADVVMADVEEMRGGIKDRARPNAPGRTTSVSGNGSYGVVRDERARVAGSAPSKVRLIGRGPGRAFCIWLPDVVV